MSMTEDLAQIVASNFKGLVEVWRHPGGTVAGRFLRVRKLIDPQAQLLRSVRIRFPPPDGEKDCDIRYEHLTTFCFNCGHIDHGESECASDPVLPFEYGDWLRVPYDALQDPFGPGRGVMPVTYPLSSFLHYSAPPSTAAVPLIHPPPPPPFVPQSTSPPQQPYTTPTTTTPLPPALAPLLLPTTFPRIRHHSPLFQALHRFQLHPHSPSAYFAALSSSVHGPPRPHTPVHALDLLHAYLYSSSSPSSSSPTASFIAPLSVASPIPSFLPLLPPKKCSLIITDEEDVASSSNAAPPSRKVPRLASTSTARQAERLARRPP